MVSKSNDADCHAAAAGVVVGALVVLTPDTGVVVVTTAVVVVVGVKTDTSFQYAFSTPPGDAKNPTRFELRATVKAATAAPELGPNDSRYVLPPITGTAYKDVALPLAL